MTKQLILALVFIIIYICTYAQTNLVPNPSFEIHTSCPSLGSEIDYAVPWHNANYGSADYFNACAPSTNNGVGVPLNGGGFQYARTGAAYSGIFAIIQIDGANYDYKEYLEVRLSDSLIEGRTYCVNFYTNYGVEFDNVYNLEYISEIGMYLSDTAMNDITTIPLPYIPQIVSPIGIFLNDTTNWMQISGTYTAHGGEKYIVIGNFKPFGQTDTMGMSYTNSLAHSAYYFIDDVSVLDCTGQGVNEHNEDNTITITPNPSEALFQVSSFRFDIESVKVFNVLGEAVNSEQVTGKSVTIDLTGFSRGVYFVEVKTDASAGSATGGIVRKKIIKQ